METTWGIRATLSSVWTTFIDDIRSDPYLRILLLASLVLSGFWLWYRVPNFASPDEYSRLIDPMKTAGWLFADPSWESLRRSITDGRALGATFYLSGLALLPVFVFVLLSGNAGAFAELGSISSRWTLWQAAPSWFWSASILVSRTTTVLIALGCVYLMYRIGLVIANRRTGRIVGASFTLSLGFVSATHEFSEDVPMLLLLLATFYLVLRYVDTGDERYFLLGSMTGGFAIAFKLTAGVTVVVLGLGLLLRARNDDRPLQRALFRPKLVGTSLLIAGAMIYVGIPSVLVLGPEALLTRILHTSTQKMTEGAGRPPIGYQILETYLNAFGLPLFVAVSGGLVSVGYRLVSERSISDAEIIVLVTFLVYLGVFSRWNWIRMHHLLPTLPLLLVPTSITIGELWNDRSMAARVLLAGVLIPTAIYAGAGTLQYADDPRDQATDWLESNAAEGTTIEVYENSIADVGVPHGMSISHYRFHEVNAAYNGSLVLNQSAYTEWMRSAPDRDVDYIELTAAELEYVESNSPRNAAYPERAAYIRRLLDGDLGYEIVVEYGDHRSDPRGLVALLRAGVFPRVEQREEYVVVLQRA